MMSNEKITSIVAKSILQPSFLDGLLIEKDTGFIKTWPAVARDIQEQSEKLKLFSAFIAKVQHNFLWNDFLVTRKLLIKFKMELTVFSAYLPMHQANRMDKSLTIADKTARFIHFLKEFLHDKRDRASMLIYAALLHEDAVRNIAKQTVNDREPLKTKNRFSLKAVPVIGKRHVLVRTYIAPAQIGYAIAVPQSIEIYKRPHCYLYWHDETINDMRVLEFSKNTERLFLLLQDKKPMQEILSCYRTTQRNEIIEVIKSLHQCGVIYYQ